MRDPAYTLDVMLASYLKRVGSLRHYEEYCESQAALKQQKVELVRRLIGDSFSYNMGAGLPGFSVTSGLHVNFLIDPNLKFADGTFNLRETVNCPNTYFNMRMRAAIHAVLAMEIDTNAAAYLMEQKTPLYRFLKERFPRMVSSEYLGDDVPLGGYDGDGLRNEDATRLTFRSEEFDFIMSFEVLEHVPDYRRALSEARRVLHPGGRFYFTAPFLYDSQAHLIRATLEGDEVVHLMEPEYHGDPVTDQGILCFQTFGWSLLDELKAAGFASAEALVFDQMEFGYWAEDPVLVFVATA